MPQEPQTLDIDFKNMINENLKELFFSVAKVLKNLIEIKILMLCNGIIYKVVK